MEEDAVVFSNKMIGKNGGSIDLMGYQLDFRQDAFEKQTLVSLTVELLVDVPDGYCTASSALQCSTLGVPFKNMATITLPIHVKVENGDVIILKQESEAKWKESQIVHCTSRDSSVKFEVSHFCHYVAVVPESSSYPIKIRHSVHFNKEEAKLCGLTCVDDEAVINKHRRELKQRGYSDAGVFVTDFLAIEPHKKMMYSLKINGGDQQIQLRPPDDVEILGSNIQASKYNTSVFTMEPHPGQGSCHLNYQLWQPDQIVLLDFSVKRCQEPTSDVVNLEVLTSTQDAYNDHLTKNGVYHILSCRRKGKALIINNRFKGSSDERRGSSVDIQNMKKLWEALGFKVTSEENLSAAEMLHSCHEFANTMGSVSVVVVVIMSHGGKTPKGKDYFNGEDNEPVLKDDVISYFTSQNCPDLDGTPKIFVFQACRVDMTDGERTVTESCPVLTDASPNTLPEDTVVAISPERADMLIIYAAQSGSAAMRNEVNGTWLINAVTNIFMEYSHDNDVLSMATMVNNAISNRRGTVHGHLQMSTQENFLRKKLYLFPGWL